MERLCWKRPTNITHCLLQMAVTETINSYFVVWTPHGMIIDEIHFDNKK